MRLRRGSRIHSDAGGIAGIGCLFILLAYSCSVGPGAVAILRWGSVLSGLKPLIAHILALAKRALSRRAFLPTLRRRHGNVRQLHYPPRWVLIPALVWGTFPVGWRRDRLTERRPAVPRSEAWVSHPSKVAARRTPAARMSQREFANQKALIEYAEQNGLVYEWQGSQAFAKRQRELSSEQYEGR
jgi:hypothetical protein